MITVQDIKREINEITDRVRLETDMRKSEKTKLKKRVGLLRKCILYLETNPTDDFLKKEIDRLENRISLIMALCPLGEPKAVAGSVIKKMKIEYEKNHDIPKFREQVRVMRFLIKGK